MSWKLQKKSQENVKKGYEKKRYQLLMTFRTVMQLDNIELVGK